jgi:3-oxoadipate enol-lactonase
VVGPSLGTSVAALWTRCASYLESHFEVLGWDLPGHGRSRAATAEFSMADLASSVREGADEVAEARPVWYAGVSLGGAVGLRLALDPGPFEGVAAIASAPRIGEPQAWTDRAELVRRAGTPVMVEASAQRWFAPGFIDRHPDVAGALLTSLADSDAGSYAWACLALRDFDVTAQIAGSKVPVLVAPGEHDVVLPPGVARSLSAGVPDLRLEVLVGCGHLPPAEAPSTVAVLLADFATSWRS